MNKIKVIALRIKHKNIFYYNVLSLTGGTLLAQLIAIISMPFITRLYTPNDFGILANFIAIISMISIIANFRYELAIVLPRYDNQAKVVLFTALYLTLIISALSIIIIIFIPEKLSEKTNIKEYLYLIPLSILFIGTYQAFNYWAIRKKNFLLIAKTKFSQVFTMLIAHLSLYKLGSSGLIIGQLLNQIMGSYKLYTYTKRNNKFKIPSLKRVKWVLYKYRNLPKFNLIGSLLDNASARSPILLLTIYFSPSHAGLYAIADRILTLPIQLIGRSLSSVYYAEAPKAYREKKLGNLTFRIYEKTVALAFPITILIMLSSPSIFSIVFGPRWEMAGYYASILSMLMYITFIASPIGSAYTILEKQNSWAFFQLLIFIVSILAIYAGIYLKNSIYAILFYSIGNIICWCIILIYLFKKLEIKPIKYLKIQFSNFLISLITNFPLIYIFYIEYNKIEKSTAYWVFCIILSALFIALRYINILKGNFK
ncbi:oligosaccharide flippase family protein [Xenorhabdus bovienii]|uniref:lipopolysaccharide biosynthesis protein n=1 Tax=Xenorhabdus bovienii TaxID=40576 RepID=UPI00237CB9EC|nr:oligosaccharide flippase family protein [Xenorhabdus bovienii]MDE1485013.1 oligosaccharide flippase family protein [Xenorhabdus bovienii]MDE9475777.1 oligosaccharide flippase family protein [Xenorhabdus bovienii]MDE9528647.1 oligosaccharide flippase family protein [Xenorhabdus bovienii]